MALGNVLSNTILGGVKEETTRGTVNALTPATGYNIELFDVAPVAIDNAPIRIGNYASGNFKKAEYISGMPKGSTSFSTYMRYGGAVSTVPEWYALMEMCGMETYQATADENIRYEGSPICKGFTYNGIEKGCGVTAPEGILQTLRGAAATFTIGAESTKAPVKIDFEVQGIYDGETDIADASTYLPSSLDTGAIQKFAAVPVTIAGVVYKVLSWSLAMQGVISALPDSGDTSGMCYFAMTDADPQLTMSLVRVDVAAKDWYADMVSDASYSAGVIIPLQDFDIEMKSAQLYQMSLEDADGFSGRSITLAVESIYIKQNN